MSNYPEPVCLHSRPTATREMLPHPSCSVLGFTCCSEEGTRKCHDNSSLGRHHTSLKCPHTSLACHHTPANLSAPLAMGDL